MSWQDLAINNPNLRFINISNRNHEVIRKLEQNDECNSFNHDIFLIFNYLFTYYFKP